VRHFQASHEQNWAPIAPAAGLSRLTALPVSLAMSQCFDHFFLRKLTDADPGIEALTHDIFAAFVSDKLDRYVGIGARELRQFRPKAG
jgi:hypothetical protein